MKILRIWECDRFMQNYDKFWEKEDVIDLCKLMWILGQWGCNFLLMLIHGRQFAFNQCTSEQIYVNSWRKQHFYALPEYATP